MKRKKFKRRKRFCEPKNIYTTLWLAYVFIATGAFPAVVNMKLMPTKHIREQFLVTEVAGRRGRNCFVRYVIKKSTKELFTLTEKRCNYFHSPKPPVYVMCLHLFICDFQLLNLNVFLHIDKCIILKELFEKWAPLKNNTFTLRFSYFLGIHFTVLLCFFKQAISPSITSSNNTKLLNYYNNKVNPRSKDKKESNSKVRGFMKRLLNNLDVYDGPLEGAGSSSTNTKVNKADEFDLNLHLNLKGAICVDKTSHIDYRFPDKVTLHRTENKYI